MRESKAARQAPEPWNVPVAVDEIAETGQHVELVADAEVRATLARVAGLRDLPRLEASFDLTRHGATGLHVVGRVSATVGQNCVVTLEPLTNDIEEDIDVVFAPPPSSPPRTPARKSDAGEVAPARAERAWDEPEPLIGGVVDLGALATEFLFLGLDPYPRKPGAVFEPPRDVGPDAGPFAALSKLTKGGDGN